MNATPHTARSRESIIDPIIARPLLGLHAATDIDSFWKAVQRVVGAIVPHCFISLTLQHSPAVPAVVKWAGRSADAQLGSEALGVFFNTAPQRRIVRASDLFVTRGMLLESVFYRECLQPRNFLHAVGLPFRRGRRLIGGIALMRSEEQNDFTAPEMERLRQLYPHLQTALLRLGAVERERSVLSSFEQFLNRLPLPAIVLRWNLQLIYWNCAAREFCSKWENGPGRARLMKAEAPLPAEILERCCTLKTAWEQSHCVEALPKHLHEEHVYHPKWPFLRATISLKQLSSAGVAQPHFLIECEELRGTEAPDLNHDVNGLSHLMRLTGREQQLVRLVCNGRSNQEIADETGVSLQTVKNHLYTIFHKLEVTSRSRLIALMR